MTKKIKSKYTAEILTPIVAASVSMADVLRKLGMKQTGGSYAWIPKVIKALGLDCSHFTGRTTNKGCQHKGGPDKLSAEEILVLDRLNGRRESLPKLRRAMLESGIPEVCVECEQIPFWREKRLVLQVEHKNGNSVDNQPGNVCFICPNCHSQTETFAGKRNRKCTT